MNFIKRLKWLATSLAVVGVITSAAVWGDATRDNKTTVSRGTPGNKLFSDDVVSRFVTKPAISYVSTNGDTYFAVQVKPTLPEAAAMPRDIAVLVDASASQAGSPFLAARSLAREIVHGAGESDRLSVWMVSTPKTTKNLVRGGGMKNPTEARTAFGPLENEYASGAIDLQATLDRVANEFDGKATRQQVIVYLGDGESALNPLDEKARQKLAETLLSKNITFYAIPLGTANNAQNLHSLVTGTGGLLIRPTDEKVPDPDQALKSLANRMLKSMSTPVLMPGKNFSIAGAAEVYPSKLPPLRSDVPTLVVGRFEKGKAPAKIELNIEGTIAGKAHAAPLAYELPTPTVDNFFLNSVVTQWRKSGQPEAPAMLRADRTLALAYESTRLAREEFIEQGDWALGVNRIDTAKTLYQHALNLDPNDGRATAGLDITRRVEKGEISVEQLKQATFQGKTGPRVDTALLVQAEAPKGAPKAEAPKAPDAAPVSDPKALLKQEEARQKIREQQTAAAVEESLKRARELLSGGDPKTAKDILIAQRDSLRVTGDIGDATRTRLLGSIGNLLDQVATQGEALLRQKAEENERIARSTQKLIAQDQQVAREEKIRERIRTFANLMNQARYEDAYQEALVMENEFTEQGRLVPKETLAVARMSQAASNYRDFRELTRLREERFLLSMMEVEKAHMPYPDEPAVHFPPAKLWREMSFRRTRYIGTDFGRDQSPKQRDKYHFLQRSLLETIDLSDLLKGEGAKEFTFGSILDLIQKILKERLKRDVTMYINQETFGKRDQPLRDARITLTPLVDAAGNALRDVSFKTILDVMCRQAEIGAGFWVTPDYIEIVGIQTFNTTRTLKVFPTEDLIVPIPNAVNSFALTQSLQVLGQVFSLGGGNAFGFLGAFGQAIQGGFGVGGGQPQGGGGAMGFIGMIMMGGQGFAGFNGGQGIAGQGLGSQFGFQGGPASQGTNGTLMELLGLIQYVVDQGYWEPDFTKLGLSAIGVKSEDLPAAGDQQDATLRNRLFVNIASRSIIVHGRSRLHPQGGSTRPLKTEVADGGRRNPDGRELAKVGGNGQNSTINENWNNNKKAIVVKPKKTVDAETAWRDAIEKGYFKPGEIIACADFLAENGEFKHASELLKASLRRGITPERWYQEALALSLEACQGNADEIERARVSAIDTDPKSAQAYLSTARALSDMGNPDTALRLSQIAAKMEPNIPDAYSDALVYAADPKSKVTYDVTAFSAGNLLSRDWPSDTGFIHKIASEQLLSMVQKLRDQNKVEEANKAEELIAASKRRDLVIKMSYTGTADLDLRVIEPIGTTCSYTTPQTTGGGVLREMPTEKKEGIRSEVYSAAEAFSGQYKIVIDHIAGRTLGNKVQIEVIRNAGTPEQRVEIHRVEVNNSKPTELVINLESGRRTDVAVLPSPVDLVKYTSTPNQSQQAMNKLRALVNGTRNVGLSGGTAVPTARTGTDSITNGSKTLMEVSWQTRLGTERSVGMDIRSQTTIRTDGTAVVAASPVFDSVKKEAEVKLDVIPGSDK